MVTDDLITYIRDQLAKGVDRDVLSRALHDQGGWSESDVASALARLDAESAPTPADDPETHDDAHSSAESASEGTAVDQGGEGTDGADGQSAQRGTVLEASPVPGPQPGPEALSSVSRSSHLLRNTLLFIVFVAAVAGGIFAYAYFILGIGRPLTPTEVLARTIAAHQAVSTVRENGDATITLSLLMPTVTASATTTASDADPGATSSPVTVEEVDMLHTITIDLGYDAALDMGDPSQVRGTLALVADARGASDLLSYRFRVDANVRYSDAKLYVRINDMTRTWLPFDPSPYFGDWILVDTSRLAAEIGTDINAELARGVREYHRLAAELGQAVGESQVVALLNERIVEITDDPTLAESTYHYTVRLNERDWEVLFRSMFDALADQAVPEGTTPDALRGELDSKRFSELYEQLSKLRVDLFIDRDSFLVTDTVVEWELDAIVIDRTTSDIDLAARTRFSAYGDPIEVRIPTASRTFEDILAELDIPLVVLTPTGGGDGSPLVFDSGYVWVGTDPVQCLGNPWEQDWLSQYVPDGSEGAVTQPAYPQGDPLVVEAPEAAIIRDYYTRLGITVRDLESITYEEKFGESVGVCSACDCAQGYSLYLQIPGDELQDMIDLGWQIADI